MIEPSSYVFIGNGQVSRSLNDEYIDIEKEYKELENQEFRLDSTIYHQSIFEWTHFRSKAEDGGLYLLLLVNRILNTIKLGPAWIEFKSQIKEAKSG